MSTNHIEEGQGRPTALVMNMFYTGLGIARTLKAKGISVIGLTSDRKSYGNHTRSAKVAICPDSRSAPEELAVFLTSLGRELPQRGVIFPTRDDDLVFLDRFRRELEPYFTTVSPGTQALDICLNKWKTYLAAGQAGLRTPKAWLIDGMEDARRAAAEATYPCILKPVAAHYWRKGGNWAVVGERKAIRIDSGLEMIAEYNAIRHADCRALLQEMVPGGDEALVIAACYVDRQSRWVAGFNTQKLVQIPEGTGTGCIVQSVDRLELFEPTARLLRAIGFTGIAEVEYKWDAAAGEYKLIEINPRPWDQHQLGEASGIDLIHMAYCDHTGLPMPEAGKPVERRKWIAEDTFLTAAARMLWRRDPRLPGLLRQARGSKRIFAIWSANDPAPFLAYVVRGLFPVLWRAGVSSLGSTMKRLRLRKRFRDQKGIIYGKSLEKPRGVN